MTDAPQMTPQEQNLRNKIREWIIESETRPGSETINRNPLHEARTQFKKSLLEKLPEGPNKAAKYTEEMKNFDKHIEAKMVEGYRKPTRNVSDEDKDTQQLGETGIRSIIGMLLGDTGGFLGKILDFLLNKVPVVGALISRGADYITTGFDSKKMAEMDKQRAVAGAVQNLGSYISPEGIEFDFKHVPKQLTQRALNGVDMDKPGAVPSAELPVSVVSASAPAAPAPPAASTPGKPSLLNSDQMKEAAKKIVSDNKDDAGLAINKYWQAALMPFVQDKNQVLFSANTIALAYGQDLKNGVDLSNPAAREKYEKFVGAELDKKNAATTDMTDFQKSTMKGLLMQYFRDNHDILANMLKETKNSKGISMMDSLKPVATSVSPGLAPSTPPPGMIVPVVPPTPQGNIQGAIIGGVPFR